VTALKRFRDALTAHNCTPKGTSAKCPVHEDAHASLSFGSANDFDGVVVKCHAGCSIDDILAELGLTISDLFDEPRQAKQGRALVAEYAYIDEVGTVLYVKQRYWPKGFLQYVPLITGDKQWKLDGVRRVLFHLPELLAAKARGETIYLAEGETDVLALERAGVAATTWTDGAWQPGDRAKWRTEYSQTLAGMDVIIVQDRDDAGRNTAKDIASRLAQHAASIKIVEAAEGNDARDHLDAGRNVNEFVPVADDGQEDDEQEPPPQAAPKHQPISLKQAHKVFKRWLGDNYDIGTLDAMLAAAAVERLDGDPLWLLIVSGSGNTKTETVQTLSSIGAIVVSAVTSEGALLSATSKRDRSKSATGGLLREIGDRGVLVIKDFTSILSMNRDMRAQVLGALREVHDGSWVRKVGSDGGQSLPSSGRIAIIGAVTTAWDTHHAVVAAMGDRFVLVRADSTKNRQAAGRKAIGNTGSEIQMRAELAQAAGGVIAGMDTTPIAVTDEERDALLAAADLVTLARTAVERDHQGNVIDAHAPEMPTRFAKELVQIVRGAVAIGMDRHNALRLAIRCARDSMPPLRLQIIDDLAAHPHGLVAEVRKRLGKPHNTVDREVQALYMLGVLKCDEASEFIQKTGKWASKWHYSLADGITPTAIDLKTFPEKSVPTPSPQEEGDRDGDRESDKQHVDTDISGNGSTSGDDPSASTNTSYSRCQICSSKDLLSAVQRQRGTCGPCHMNLGATIIDDERSA
jgi:hypothetical protein